MHHWLRLNSKLAAWYPQYFPSVLTHLTDVYGASRVCVKYARQWKSTFVSVVLLNQIKGLILCWPTKTMYTEKKTQTNGQNTKFASFVKSRLLFTFRRGGVNKRGTWSPKQWTTLSPALNAFCSLFPRRMTQSLLTTSWCVNWEGSTVSTNCTSRVLSATCNSSSKSAITSDSETFTWSSSSEKSICTDYQVPL